MTILDYVRAIWDMEDGFELLCELDDAFLDEEDEEHFARFAAEHNIDIESDEGLAAIEQYGWNFDA